MSIPRVALLPSAGMGHLTPFCRLAAALVERGCEVSFIVVKPTVSSAESRYTADLLAAYPKIRTLELHVPTLDGPGDPFFRRFEAISRNAHLLPPLLAGPTFSALVIDISLASAYIPIASAASVPPYVLFTASAAMFSLVTYFPTYTSNKTTAAIEDVHIPGFQTLPKASVPAMLHDPSHLFTKQFVESARASAKADGILINTFEALEPLALAALNSGAIEPSLPPVMAIGPMKPIHLGRESAPLPWLDAQDDKSVVYVSFGSRTAMSADQIRQLAIGLDLSGSKFLWVIKSKKVDREEKEGELEKLLGQGYLERVEGRGLVVNGWVEQEDVLKHRAVGGFLSHCGWNSVTEAALYGVRVLAWPRHGDQRVNAGVVRASGMGVWVEEWSWEGGGEGEEKLVAGEDIAAKVKKLMGDEEVERSAARVAEEAKAAVAAGGSLERGLDEFIAKLKV